MRRQEASRLSSDCAMCYWGFAHACGPNLNEPHKTPAELQAGQLAASRAAQLLEQSPEIYSAKEQVKGWEMRGGYREGTCGQTLGRCSYCYVRYGWANCSPGLDRGRWNIGLALSARWHQHQSAKKQPPNFLQREEIANLIQHSCQIHIRC